MNKITWPKAVSGILLSLVILVISQLLAQLTGDFLIKLPVPKLIAIFITSVLYPLLSIIGITLILNKLLKIPMEVMRITKFRTKSIWLITAILLPTLVIAAYFFTGAELNKSSLETKDLINEVIYGIGLASIGAGIVEEMVFRGVMMGLLEKKTNKYVAVILPSVIFGSLHVIGTDIGIAGFIQLVIAGTFVGIMFSLICRKENSFWSGALIHVFWNASQWIIFISTKTSDTSVFTLKVRSNSFLITGGDFGYESSLISIIAYSIVIIMTLVMTRRHKGPSSSFSYSEVQP